MGLELEAKFAVPSLDPLRRTLRSMGAEPLGRRFERNAVFDTPAREMLARGELLRLRQTDKAKLTFKRPSGRPAPAGVKAMDEVETVVADFEAMRRVLAGLGYQEALWYEKFREQWRLPHAVVCLDDLPFGCFVEIEGEPEAIAEVAGRLGLDMARAKADTYHTLFRQHLLAHGLPPQDSFTFSAEDKARLQSV